MQAAVFLNHFLMNKWKTKWQKKQKTWISKMKQL